MNNKSKHILYAIPCLKLGGTEIQMLSVIKALPQNYKKTVLVYFNEIDTDIVKRYKDENCDMQFLNLERKNFCGIFGALRLIKIIQKKFKNSGADIVHIQYLAPAFQPIVAAWLAGKRIFATIHTSGGYYSWYHKLLVRVASLLTKKFICVSKNAEIFWFGNTNKTRRHQTIRNYIDIDNITQTVLKNNWETLFQKFSIPKQKRIICYAGRLVEPKGVHYLFETFRQLNKQYNDIHLLIIGDGIEKPFLEKKVSENLLTAKVTFTGNIPQEDVFTLISKSYIFVMPSYFEGFGLSAAEAMCLGIPVVGSNVDGLREIIEHNKSGILVPIKNAVALKEAVSKMLDEDDLYEKFSTNSKNYIEQHFSKTIYKEQLNKLYDIL